MRPSGNARVLVRVPVLLLLLALSVLAHATEPRPLVVATYAYPDRDRAAAITPLANYLRAQLKRPVDIRVLPSPTALIDAMYRNEVDVAVPNLYGYLRVVAGSKAIATLPVPDVPPAQAQRYRSVIVARSSMTMRELAQQAAQLRLALVGEDSVSGCIVPAKGLNDAGVRLALFESVDYAGSHAAALQRLADGQVDVAALAADVFDASPHPGLHEVWRSDVIPPGPLLCRMSDQLSCKAVGDALLRVGQDDPRVMAGLRAGWPEFGDAERMKPAPVTALMGLATRLGE